MIAYHSTEIEDYVNGLTDFQKKAVLEIREAILSADSRVKEGIKWGSIAFFQQQKYLRVSHSQKPRNHPLYGRGFSARQVPYSCRRWG